MIIPDETLRDERKFDRVCEQLDNEVKAFRRSDQGQILEARYWNAPQSVYRDLKVRWDYRPIAIRLNRHTNSDNLRDCQLYECASDRLFALLSGDDHLRFDRLFEDESVEKNNLLRVIGHWEVGALLTPPFLELKDDGTLIGRDGFHRLAVAFAAQVASIPFWAVLKADVAGVYKIGTGMVDCV